MEPNNLVKCVICRRLETKAVAIHVAPRARDVWAVPLLHHCGAQRDRR
jgi:hypothetical protein